MKVTKKNLECLVERLNKMFGYETRPYYQGSPNKGTYFIDYDSFSMKQIGEDGEEINIIPVFNTKKVLYGKIESFMAGIEVGRKERRK